MLFKGFREAPVTLVANGKCDVDQRHVRCLEILEGEKGPGKLHPVMTKKGERSHADVFAEAARNVVISSPALATDAGDFDVRVEESFYQRRVEHTDVDGPIGSGGWNGGIVPLSLFCDCSFEVVFPGTLTGSSHVDSPLRSREAALYDRMSKVSIETFKHAK